MTRYRLDTATGEWVETRRDYLAPRPPMVRVKGAGRPIYGWSLPWREEMTPEQAAKVPAWTEEGVPIFQTEAQAKAWCAVSDRAVEKDGQGQTWRYGDDAPTPTEVSEAYMEGQRIRCDR